MELKITKKELIFPYEQKYFNSCHSSTFIVAPNGDYLVTYYGGQRELTPDNNLYLSRYTKGVWEPPKAILTKHKPYGNCVLFRDGNRIYIFIKSGTSPQTWTSYLTYSDDNGYTWAEEWELCPGDNYSRGPVRNKVIVASDGSWLAPSSTEEVVLMDCFVDRSTDKGKTWQKCPIPIAHNESGKLYRNHLWQGLINDELWECNLDNIEKWDGVIQPTLWRSTGSNVHAFMRSSRGHIYRSDSKDDGKTWCQAYETYMPNNCCGIDVDRFEDGTLVLVYNPVPWNWGPRSPISIAYSTDNGETFSEPLHLETLDGELSYPSVNIIDDIIHVTFTIHRKTFMHCECILEK